MTGRASPAPTPTQASPRDVAVDDYQQTPRHGLVYRVGSKRKDEDRAVAGEHVTCGGERFAYFAIFDGHGGKDAADRCQATLHDQISRRAPDTTKATDALSEGLRRACWELDEDLGSAHVDAGTTATILCIGRSTATLGWVGDSTALVVDMTLPKPAWATPKHNPQNPSEVARMKAEWGARREFLLYESPDGEDQAYNEAMDAFTATYEKRLADHFRAQNLPPLRPNLIRDSMRRETLINDRCDRVNTMRRKQSFEAVTKFGKVVSGQDMDATIDMKRHDSNFTRRTSPEDGRPRGPVVVGANWRGRRPGTTVGGASTCVTRSIGDWDASRAVIPEPETKTWDTSSVFDRVVLASDGLWDLVSFEAAATCMRSVDDPQKAAQLLLKRAKSESARRGYSGLKDDTTILVVDINPNSLKVTETAQGCACAVS